MNKIKALACLAIPLLLISCSLTSTPKVKQGVSVPVPVNIKNSVADANLTKDAAIVIKVQSADQIWVNDKPSSREDLSSTVADLLKKKTAGDTAGSLKTPAQTIYLEGAKTVDFGVIAEVCYYLQREDVKEVALVVSPTDALSNPTNILPVVIPPEPTPDNFTPPFHEPGPNDPKPSMRDLVGAALTVSISKDGLIRFQNESGLTAERAQALIQGVLKSREEQKAFKPGTQEIDKSVIVRAARSLSYGEVVRNIDAVKGAGAEPVILQINDLAQ